MKVKIFLFASIAILCVACEKSDQIVNGGDHFPRMNIELVKFTDNKYRECIMGEQVPGLVRLPQHLGKPVAVDLLIGSQPYMVELPNGYWVKNWKWPVGLLNRSTTILLPYKWETITNWSQTWDIPDTILEYDQYIADFREIKRVDIDKFLALNTDVNRNSALYGILYLLPKCFDRYNSIEDIPEEEKDSYYMCIQEQDSLHAIYVQRLTDIINNGGFDELCAK